MTDGTSSDFDPYPLPNGRLVFLSDRRGGFGRCYPSNPLPTYVLHSMRADGTDIVPLSYHETCEWHPSVNNDGMIVYTRLDYVDRGDCIAHHPWKTYEFSLVAPGNNSPSGDATAKGHPGKALANAVGAAVQTLGALGALSSTNRRLQCKGGSACRSPRSRYREVEKRAGQHAVIPDLYV